MNLWLLIAYFAIFPVFVLYEKEFISSMTVDVSDILAGQTKSGKKNKFLYAFMKSLMLCFFTLLFY